MDCWRERRVVVLGFRFREKVLEFGVAMNTIFFDFDWALAYRPY